MAFSGNRIIFQVIITLLLSACAQLTITPASESSTPISDRQIPTLSTKSVVNPSPTFAPTPTPKEQAISYPQYGIRFVLPKGYQLVEQPIGGDLRLWLGVIMESDVTSGSPFPPINLRVFEKPESTDFLDWFSAYTGDCFPRGEKPPAGMYFSNPIVEDQEDFKGKLAIRYESGCWPVPYELLVEHGRWLVGLAYLRDNPIDYQARYEHILASVEFFEPEENAIVQASTVPPSPTPTVCLGQAALPIEQPPRQTPLEVRFISDGNLWVWMETKQITNQISETGDAQTFSFSPDGEVIAFTRGQPYSQTELWAINRDGTNLRLLVSAGQLHELVGVPTTTKFTYTDSLNYLDWFTGTHTLRFEILRSYDAIDGCCESGGTWQVDVDTGKLAVWTPLPDKQVIQAGLVSPDGSQVVLIGETGSTLINIDGTHKRTDVLKYPYIPQPEGGGFFTPQVYWATDSQSLLAITYSEDIWEADTTFTTWRVPLDGSPPQQLAIFSGNPFSVYLSPNQKYLAYIQPTSPQTNDHELHLAIFDGSRDVIYAQGHTLEFWGWALDGVHFIFGQFSTLAPYWGDMCAGSQALLNPLVLPARQFTWLDSETFLFVKGSYEDPQAELRLGKVGDSSLLIGPFNGEYAQYQFVTNPKDVGDEQ